MIKASNIRKMGGSDISFDLVMDYKTISCEVRTCFLDTLCPTYLYMRDGPNRTRKPFKVLYDCDSDYCLRLFKYIRDKDFTEEVEDHLRYCQLVDEWSNVPKADNYNESRGSEYIVSFLQNIQNESKNKRFIRWIKSKLGIA